MKTHTGLLLVVAMAFVGAAQAEDHLAEAPAAETTSSETAEAQPVRQAPPFAAAARRGGGGYQQIAPERLTCDDYSLSYFRRHPTVATVCGVDISEDSVETISTTAPGVQISATIHKVVNTSQTSALPKAPSSR